MFETLKRLYYDGKLIEAQLDIAVEKNWITQEQVDEIKAV